MKNICLRRTRRSEDNCERVELIENEEEKGEGNVDDQIGRSYLSAAVRL